MTTDPNPTPVPGTYLSTNRSVQASGEACVQACGEVSGEAALRQQIEDLLDEFAGVTETRIVAGEIVARLLWRKLAELDRLRAELHDHIDGAVRSGERLMDTQTEALETIATLRAERDQARAERSRASEAENGFAGVLMSAGSALDGLDLGLGDDVSIDHEVRVLRERYDALRAEVARLSSGDTPIPADMLRAPAPQPGTVPSNWRAQFAAIFPAAEYRMLVGIVESWPGVAVEPLQDHIRGAERDAVYAAANKYARRAPSPADEPTAEEA